MGTIFAWIILVLYSAFLLFIFCYSLVQWDLVRLYRRRQRLPQPLPEQLRDQRWPDVTVQLPVYNEKYVVERLIQSVIRLDYPTDRLHIQVLDDSTDESADIAADMVDSLRSERCNIDHVQRDVRTGFKAGALENGLSSATGELIAIFDADFVPRPEFLKEVVPHFSDAQVGLVQARWEHLNENYNVLTQLQAFGLDAHFTVEQGGRNEGKGFINFNGTAGVWRKKTIEDAGGWSSDTLTEDLDLSYRAQLKGWKFVYRGDIGVPAELPIEMNALKTQQYRWTKGAAECAVKNLGRVLTAQLPVRTKVHALFHLTNSFIFISVFAAAMLSVPLMWLKYEMGWSRTFIAAGSIFLISLILLVRFYWVSFEERSMEGKWVFAKRFACFLTLSMGMSLHNAVAVWEGYVGKKSPFLRTPKFRSVNKDSVSRSNRYKMRSAHPIAWLELALSVWFGLALFLGLSRLDFGLAPFHLLLTIGFFLSGGLSVRDAYSSGV